jgi:hypothetical protein
LDAVPGARSLMASLGGASLRPAARPSVGPRAAESRRPPRSSGAGTTPQVLTGRGGGGACGFTKSRPFEARRSGALETPREPAKPPDGLAARAEQRYPSRVSAHSRAGPLWLGGAVAARPEPRRWIRDSAHRRRSAHPRPATQTGGRAPTWAPSPRAEPCSGRALRLRRGGARCCAQTRIDHRRLGVAQAVFSKAACVLNDARGV